MAGSGASFRSHPHLTQWPPNRRAFFAMVSLEDYAGREQSYVKHVFLERYLEALIFKTASVYNHIVYVDGFAGPWQSANERFEDTSFGIALNSLRRAKETWKTGNRNVRMTALLVERHPKAYAQLTTIQ